VQLFLTQSADPLVWPAPQQLTQEAGENFYPTIIAPGADPRQSAGSFYVYYLHSSGGGFKKYQDGALERRLVTLTPPPPSAS
jgi:hypothetical protein